MENDALRVRRAALVLMDAADLLDEDRKQEARARAQEVVKELDSVFWPELDESGDGLNAPD